MEILLIARVKVEEFLSYRRFVPVTNSVVSVDISVLIATLQSQLVFVSFVA